MIQVVEVKQAKQFKHTPARPTAGVDRARLLAAFMLIFLPSIPRATHRPPVK